MLALLHGSARRPRRWRRHRLVCGYGSQTGMYRLKLPSGSLQRSSVDRVGALLRQALWMDLGRRGVRGGRGRKARGALPFLGLVPPVLEWSPVSAASLQPRSPRSSGTQGLTTSRDFSCPGQTGGIGRSWIGRTWCKKHYTARMISSACMYCALTLARISFFLHNTLAGSHFVS